MFRYRLKNIKIIRLATCIVTGVPASSVHNPAHSGLFGMELLGKRMKLCPYNALVTNLNF